MAPPEGTYEDVGTTSPQPAIREQGGVLSDGVEYSHVVSSGGAGGRLENGNGRKVYAQLDSSTMDDEGEQESCYYNLQ